ncbi:DUF4097 domain-containing protein [Ruminococcaceae bacterium OttesenSCG-928-A16]|nr:DUF4097 domain-containing protein [Ruminococcaceae bacterium OttesenSCG-928-A16]
MTDKIKKYLDDLFENIPPTREVKEAKDELYDGMMERYADGIKTGLDEQEAYDAVIDSLGDIRELFDELNMDMSKDAPQAEAAGEEQTQQASGDNTDGKKPSDWQINLDLSGLLGEVADFTSGLVNGFLGGGEYNGLPLVNTQALPLEGISNLDISYVAEAVTVRYATDNQLTIKEYMNREDPTLLADISQNNGSIIVRNGRRAGLIFLRSYIEVYLPASWSGSLSIYTVSGTIKSDDAWILSSLNAKTTSGQVRFSTVVAPMVRLSSTSGSIALQKGVGTLEVNTVSGSIKIDAAEGDGSFKTISGSVRVHFDALRGHVNTSTVSGGIRLGLPAGASFELNAKSVSGNIHTGFDSVLSYTQRNKVQGFVGPAPYYNINIQSTSGGIHVND